ncbi:T-complex protein 1 subunit zeta [Thraustotheca clavata]|uniref:T-complex protein 1 subunit zeta n=1 Tax=Thraustotheca clavata TaxID=74557 RepID=A0A1V9ZXA9_9STRA|nr:T-complex protein 1 subunit zeta [Thraustotheca clavata]
MSFGKTNYRFGGTRGGQDQFKWEDVKNDKYRENYLGHSLNAPVGRWAKGKDLTWYAKNKDEQKAALAEEIAIARQRDEDLMNEALGIAPKRKREASGLDANEMKELLKRGETERGVDDAERVQGVGAAHFVTGYEDPNYRKTTMAERYQANLGKEDITYKIPGSEDASQSKERKKSKKEKKEKKDKKEKKEKKSKKTHKRSRSRDRSSDRKRSRSRDRSSDRKRSRRD